MIIVNKKHLFNEKDIDQFEMIEYENYKEDFILVESETFRHFDMLRAHLQIEGIIIDIDSAYRSLETQENIFLKFMNKYVMDYANKYVAMPGTSEHHTGQAIDLIIKKDDKWIVDNNELCNEVEIFDKIHRSLKYFGFILRYPKGKEDVTGFPYEPWHIRYVSEEVAMNIGNKTLEEYLEK